MGGRQSSCSMCPLQSGYRGAKGRVCQALMIFYVFGACIGYLMILYDMGHPVRLTSWLILLITHHPSRSSRKYGNQINWVGSSARYSIRMGLPKLHCHAQL